MSALQDMVVKIRADVSGLKSGVDDAKKDLSGLDDSTDKSSSGLAGLGTSILSFAGGAAVFAGVSAGVGALSGFLTDSVGVAQQAQQTQALLSNAIKDTGGASGQTISSLEDMADHLSTVTTYSKDTVEGVQQIALRAKIPPGLFAETTQSSLDMAQAMGISAPNAANVLTKALDNPAMAAAQLRREHINLTDAQQQAIATDVKHGDSLGAQTVILNAVKDSYGNAAQAAGDTFGGKLQILQNQLENTKEKIGNAILPILTQFMGAVMPLVNQFTDALPGALKIATGVMTNNVVPILKDATTVISTDLVPAVQNVMGKVGDFATFLQTHQAAMEAFKAILAVVAIVIAVALVAAFISWAIAAGAAAIATIAATWPILLIGLAIGLLIVGIIELVQHWQQISDFLQSVWAGNVAMVQAGFSALGSAAHNLWNDITGAFTTGLTTINNAINNGINAIINGATGWGKSIIQNLINGISSMAGSIASTAKSVVGNALSNIPMVGQLMPHFAGGGMMQAAGLAVVGENGPELVQLPSGAQVYSASQSAGMVGGGGSGVVAASAGAQGADVNGGGGGYRTANIYFQVDGRVLAQAVGQPLVDLIRVRTGMKL